MSSSTSGRKPLGADTISFRLYAFLARKLGYRREPKAVPLFVMARAIGCSYDQVRKRIGLLVEMGLIERWTVKHPKQFKITYYRLTFTDSMLEESQASDPPHFKRKGSTSKKPKSSA